MVRVKKIRSLVFAKGGFNDGTDELNLIGTQSTVVEQKVFIVTASNITRLPKGL